MLNTKNTRGPITSRPSQRLLQRDQANNSHKHSPLPHNHLVNVGSSMHIGDSPVAQRSKPGALYPQATEKVQILGLTNGQSSTIYLPRSLLRKLLKRQKSRFLLAAWKNRASGVPSWGTCLWVATLSLCSTVGPTIGHRRVSSQAQHPCRLRTLTLKGMVQRWSLDVTA